MASFGLVSAMNIYAEGNILLGVASVQLPAIEVEEVNFNNSGIGGSVDIPTSRLLPMKATINFEQFFNEQFALVKLNSTLTIEVTTAEPNISNVDGENDVIPMRYILKGQFKKVDLGERKFSEKYEPSFEMNVSYMRIEQDGIELIEVNPFDPIAPFKNNGVGVTYGDALRLIF